MISHNSRRWDDWIRQALGGNQNAYHLLLTDLELWLTAYFRKRIHRNTVEDLVQDTLMTLHAKKQTFNPRYSFFPWMATIARHHWIDQIPKNLKYASMDLDHEFPSQENISDICAKHDVETLLRLIPPAQAQVIEMVKLQEMSIEDVCKKTGRSVSSVKIMVHRGMKKMMSAVSEVPGN